MIIKFNDPPNFQQIERISTKLCDVLGNEITKDDDTYWDGKTKIIEMKTNPEGLGNNKWKQMEWIGFYFEFIWERKITQMKVRYNKTIFDSFVIIPWDLKTHALNGTTKSIPVNDLAAIKLALEEHDYIGFIVLFGNVVYCRDGSFKKWHDELKGVPTEYVKQRELEGRYSRKRKSAFTPKYIRSYVFGKDDLDKMHSFQKGMKNSNGMQRKDKPLITLNTILDNITYELEL